MSAQQSTMSGPRQPQPQPQPHLASERQGDVQTTSLDKKYSAMLAVTKRLAEVTQMQEDRLAKAEWFVHYHTTRPDHRGRVDALSGVISEMHRRMEISEARARQTEAALERLSATNSFLARRLGESEKRASDLKGRLDSLMLNDASGTEEGMGLFPRVEAQVGALSRRLDRAEELSRETRGLQRGMLGVQDKLVKRVDEVEQRGKKTQITLQECEEDVEEAFKQVQGTFDAVLDCSNVIIDVQRDHASSIKDLHCKVAAVDDACKDGTAGIATAVAMATVASSVAGTTRAMARGMKEAQDRRITDLAGKVDILRDYVDGLVENHIDEVPAAVEDIKRQLGQQAVASGRPSEDEERQEQSRRYAHAREVLRELLERRRLWAA